MIHQGFQFCIPFGILSSVWSTNDPKLRRVGIELVKKSRHVRGCTWLAVGLERRRELEDLQ
jgi:hypothetical protein